MVPPIGTYDQPSRGVLDPLKFMDEVVWKPIEKAIALVESGRDECMNQVLSHFSRQTLLDLCEVLEMVVRCRAYFVDMRTHVKMRVKYSSQISG